MKIQISLLLAALVRFSTVSALLEEETGVNDFLVATSGHGPIQTLYTTGSAVLTSDSVDAGQLIPRRLPTSCTVALRNASSGALIWRLHVCSTKTGDESHHVLAATSDSFFTVDQLGVLRAWTMDAGVLLWDSLLAMDPPGSTAIRLWTASGMVAAAVDDALVLFNAVNGRVVGQFSAAAVSGSKGSAVARWLAVITIGNELIGLTGIIQKDMVTQMILVHIAMGEEGTLGVPFKTNLPNHARFHASSLQIVGGSHVVGLGADGTAMVQVSMLTADASQQIEISQFNLRWTKMEALESQSDGVIRVTGFDDRYAPPKYSLGLFRFDGKGSWDQPYDVEGINEATFGAMGYCAAASLAFSLDLDASLTAYHVGNIVETDGSRSAQSDQRRQNIPLTPIQVDGDVLAIIDEIVSATVLSCNDDAATILLTTKMGTTAAVILTKTSKDIVTAEIAWTAEEGLSSVSSGLLLDASHSSAITDAASEEEQKKTLQALSFSSRLQSQAAALTGMFAALATSHSRDNEFGFTKVAVLLSQKTHRVWGVPTAGSKRGKPTWMMNLPQKASRHVLVQGTASSSSTIHGINGGTHSHEVLILSSLTGGTQWTCLDGITGKIHASGSSQTPAAIRQIIPIFGGGSCRQVAMLVIEDGSVIVIPDDEATLAAVADKIKSIPNGFYTHILSKEKGSLETFRVIDSGNGNSLSTLLVGQTSFGGEKIVNVAYPQREEIIQSPCNILGDNSLLLKYLNPHMVAVVTISGSAGPSAGPIAAALSSNNIAADGKTKIKPIGVTPPNDISTPAKSVPNLFVNLVDTVSGRVLYRSSHANAVVGDGVPVLISENWVVYAFFNEMTKRSELGVLSMHEGMIDRTGLTAFTSPEQAGTFSSLVARESKPVVLAKTYTIVRPITALGVTATKGGISTKHLLIASGDDRITSIPRNLLEPRRPIGALKPVEKEEGLVQYHPLVPLVTMMSPSYNQTVHAVTTIMSAPTDLESQSLVLAFGGPDIFFARLAPSKGFDLLPEDFNRMLLTIVVIGLLVVLVVARTMSRKKTIKLGWLDFKA